MKVRATKLGYYGHARRRPGDVFEIDDACDAEGNVLAFSKNWMERLDGEKEKVDAQPTRAHAAKAQRPVVARDVI